MKKVAFAVVGVRNFAAEHIKQLGLLAEEGLGELKAVVITDMDKNKAKAQELPIEESQSINHTRSCWKRVKAQLTSSHCPHLFIRIIKWR